MALNSNKHKLNKESSLNQLEIAEYMRYVDNNIVNGGFLFVCALQYIEFVKELSEINMNDSLIQTYIDNE